MPTINLGTVRGIADAPIDGEKYVRKNGQWVYLLPQPTRLYSVADNSIITEFAGTAIPAFYNVNWDYGTDFRLSLSENTVSIGEQAFFENGNIRTLLLPDALTTLGDYAFYGCSCDEFEMGNGLVSIGQRAFADFVFPPATSLNFPNTLTEIGWRCFSPRRRYNSTTGTFTDGNNVTSVHFGSGLTSMGEYAFAPVDYDTHNTIASITFDPNFSLTYLPMGAFFDCPLLTHIELPNSVVELRSTSWSNGPFAYSGLTSIDLNNVTHVGAGSFNFNSQLASVNLRNVQVIEYSAFGRSYALSQIVFPPSLVSIGFTSFLDSGLTSVDIPATVMDIQEAAFQGCNSLTTVVIHSSNLFLGSGCFSYCPILNSATLTGQIPTGWETSNVFAECPNLMSINVPADWSSLGESYYGIPYNFVG